MAIVYIDDELRSIINQSFDELIETLGKTCRLHFPSIFEDCDNCFGNTWKTGGPMPFEQGVCPQCGGTGQRATVNTYDIKMTMDWGGAFGTNNRVWSSLTRQDGTTHMPDTLIQTRGYATDLMKVRQAESMTVIEPEHPMMSWNFKLANEPYDYFSITQARYFIAFWKRAG